MDTVDGFPSAAWKAARIVACSLLLASCSFSLSGCPWLKSWFSPDTSSSSSGTSTISPATDDFLDAHDFAGSGIPSPRRQPVLGGQSKYDGRIVFANLPVNVVKQVLPSDLQLASRATTNEPNVHPVLLMYGYQLDTQWVLPTGPVPTTVDYKELILMIPFVQRVGGTGKWHNYAVRMYLDADLPIFLGNAYYGYFKQKAAFDDPSETATPLKVLKDAVEMFRWSIDSSETAVPHTTALGTVANYKDALDIIGLPILGTMVELGNVHSCAYWDWDMTNASVRHIDVSFEFVQPFREGMDGWVGLGTQSATGGRAFEMTGVKWQLALPPFACQF